MEARLSDFLRPGQSMRAMKSFSPKLHVFSGELWFLLSFIQMFTQVFVAFHFRLGKIKNYSYKYKNIVCKYVYLIYIKDIYIYLY